MDDVKNNNNSVSQTSGEGNTTVAPQTTETNPVEAKVEATSNVETPKPDTTAERTIPYGRFQEVNSKYKDALRKIATLEGQSKAPQYEDLDSVRNHPYVQELELKQAEGELKRGAEDILQRYPNIHSSVKRAILQNPRGYVQRTTTDVPNALLDIEEYIQSIADEEVAPTPQPKQFPVAGTNTPQAPKGTSLPLEINKILKKPVDEWTEEEAQKLEAYKAGQI